MRIPLIDADPSLLGELDPVAAEDARGIQVGVSEIPAAPWFPPMHERPGELGWLLAGGLLLREVSIDRDWAGEIISEGDLIRPWLEDPSSFVKSRWEALTPVRLAHLDRHASGQIAAVPQLVDVLTARTIRRIRTLAAHAVIGGVHRIDQRLLLLFWHLAERRGEMAEGKAVVPIRLTHAHLARLVGARRPTVTTALGSLQRAGAVTRLPDGSWELSGEPPNAAIPA